MWRAAAFSRMIDRLFANSDDTCTGSRSSSHLAGFDLGQIEDVVDQREQVLAAAEDVADEAALLLGHLADQAVLEHLGEADDRVERRAQLVRHVGEELGLHPARVLELDVLLLQRLLEALELGHVARRGEHALQPAGRGRGRSSRCRTRPSACRRGRAR